MKQYENIKSLEQFGIFYLTGEACNINLRSLCILNDQGIELWKEMTGTIPTSPSMNESLGSKSVMIPDNMMIDLFIFGSLYNGALAVIEWESKWGSLHRTQYTALENEKEVVEASKNPDIRITYTWKPSSHPAIHLNNVHQMAGKPVI